MLQIARIVAAILALRMGLRGSSPAGLAVSSERTLTGPSARVAGGLLIAFAAAILAFAPAVPPRL